MKFHDIDQTIDRDEWLEMRVGKIGGSKLGTVMSNYGKAFGDPAQKLAVNLALERITGKSQENGYINDHMIRGLEQEPIARAMYESERFVDVLNGGFFDSGNIGVSPDGLVGTDGVIEIKSVIGTTHYKTVARDKFDPSYKWQLYLNLLVTGRDWIDFISYCSEFPVDRRLFVDRIYREKAETVKMFDKIHLRLIEFEELVAEKITVINAA